MGDFSSVFSELLFTSCKILEGNWKNFFLIGIKHDFGKFITQEKKKINITERELLSSKTNEE